MIVSLVTGAVSLVAYLRQWVLANRRFFGIVLVSMVLFGSLTTFWFGFGPNKVIVWMDPLDTELQAGNWQYLICALNAVAHCAPAHRPILIVRELANLTPPSLTNLLTALEPMKQGAIRFPVFLETSDFLWLQNERVIKSDLSFEPYYLNEMNFTVGCAELVDKYKIWTKAEFVQVYEAAGGHMGSLSALFHMHKVAGLPLSDAIKQMDNSADRQMDAAMEGCKQLKEAEEWLKNFTVKGSRIKVKGTPATIMPLLTANILFKAGFEIYAQNRLLQRAIGRYVDTFVPN